MRDLPPDHTTRALQEGAKRSREASSAPDSAPLPVRLWRRHKWKIIALLLFGLLDYVLVGGGYIGGHF